MDLLLGTVGFMLCCLFDFNKIRWQIKSLNLFFWLGDLLILVGTVLCILSGDLSFLQNPWSTATVLFLSLAVLSVAALIYTLFFALPFDHTYLEAEDLPLVQRGVYGACRHPGFWPFLAVYVFLACFLRSPSMALCGLVYSLENLLYIYIQDRWIFPCYIRGYADYRRQVPFLIPTGESLRKAFPRN